MTPGIIPRQRGDLAKSIGRMVSKELITEEALRTHISSPEFNASLSNAIASYIDSILEVELSGMFGSGKKDAEASGENPLLSVLGDIVSQEAFTQSLSKLIFDIIQNVDVQIPVGNIGGLFEAILKEPERIEDISRAFLSKAAEQNVSVETIASNDVLDALEEIISRELPFIGGKVVEFLKRPEIKKELEKRGIGFLRNIFSKFNSIQRFFITAGQYDITLEENMGEIIDDLTIHIHSMFNDPERTRDMARMVRKALEEKKHLSLKEILNTQRIDSVSRWIAKFLSTIPVSEIRSALESKDLRIHSASVTKYIEPVHIENLLKRILGWRKENAAQGGSVQVVFSKSVFFDSLKSMKVGTLLPVCAESRDRIASYATAQILKLVERKSTDIIEALDVYSLVVRKIDSLDIASVERLLLQVIEKHLKWINLFGAVLGALIGGIQILLNSAGI